MSIHYACDGVKRRDFLRVGAMGGVGLTLANYLRLSDAGEVKAAPGQAGIFINLTGGPSHMDTFDLKPDAPAEYRGTFNPIQTNVTGVEFCEHLVIVQRVKPCQRLETARVEAQGVYFIAAVGQIVGQINKP